MSNVSSPPCIFVVCLGITYLLMYLHDWWCNTWALGGCFANSLEYYSKYNFVSKEANNYAEKRSLRIILVGIFCFISRAENLSNCFLISIFAIATQTFSIMYRRVRRQKYCLYIHFVVYRINQTHLIMYFKHFFKICKWWEFLSYYFFFPLKVAQLGVGSFW